MLTKAHNSKRWWPVIYELAISSIHKTGSPLVEQSGCDFFTVVGMTRLGVRSLILLLATFDVIRAKLSCLHCKASVGFMLHYVALVYVIVLLFMLQCMLQ